MKQRWNDIDRGNPKDSEKNLSQCHFFHREFHALDANPDLRGENKNNIYLKSDRN
jgi:hypothetical protein